MKKLKIKVCGMRDPDNIKDLLALNPDFMGLIFYPKSARYVNKPLPDIDFGNTLKTGVFVNENIKKLLKIATNYSLEVIQLHGNESPEYTQEVKKHDYQVIKVFPVDNNFDFSICQTYMSAADYFLFDTKGKLPGGNGTVFTWDILQNYKLDKPFLLSGGINMSHLKSIINLQHPMLFGVDVNSGFETQPAYKNINDLKIFINEIRS